MSAREQRGLEIAARLTLVRKGTAWLVPSQSGNGRYTVCLDAADPHCTCPDHETRGEKCKHIYAVEFAVQNELTGERTVEHAETYEVRNSSSKTYPQDWRAYNAAQTHEKEQFLAGC